MEFKGRNITPRVVHQPGVPHDVMEAIVAMPRARDPEPTKPLITMYVRRGETPKTRTLSLHPIPDKVNMDELLELGFALDGDSASMSIEPGDSASYRDHYLTSAMKEVQGNPQGGFWTTEADKNGVHHMASVDPADVHAEKCLRFYGSQTTTLFGALNDAQRAVLAWLRDLGYDVKIA